MAEGKTCKALYEQLSTDRAPYLERAREAASVTIPTLMPPSSASGSTPLPTPHQSVGARGVNNLAAKLLLSLLPPNSPFFRLLVDDFTKDEIDQQPNARAVIEKALNRIERAVTSEIESIGLRSPVFECLKQLIVAGDVQLYIPKKGKPRVYTLDQYVVLRDPVGNLLMTIIKEEVAFDALSDEEKALVADNPEGNGSDSQPKPIEVYTKFWRDGDKYRRIQEIDGKVVPGSEGQWDLDKSALLSLRWSAIDGEHYGRGYVEEYLGDLISLEGLMKAILEGAAASARILIMVSPNGSTRFKDVANAPNGAVVQGNAEEVTFLQAQKYADFSVAQQTAREIVDRLQFAFLLNTSIQRNAERVTAEEIRFMAGELEDALGGTYSILSQEFQLPLVNRLMDRMTKEKRLPALPDGIVRPAIVTGLDALGRGHDLNKYKLFFEAISVLPPEEVARRIDVSDYMARVAASVGIDADGLVKSEEQVQAEAQAAMQNQLQQLMAETAGGMAERATPEAVKGIVAAATQGTMNG